MFKIEIQSDDGRELKISRDNFVYFKAADGRDTFWEWEHIRAKSEAFDPLFDQASKLIDEAEAHLPDWPMSGLR
ncbi:MAG: hypothetical protein WBY88_07565 [Desulfosarcina sp.]